VLAPGTRLGPYEIDCLLGKGGMGDVYRGRDTRLDRAVAIKLIAGLADESARRRLRQEARAAATLNHPHICTIYEIDEGDDRLFIVMEYVPGRPLSELVTEGVPPATVIRHGVQIADALSHAHERGIVHRDLKSANLLVTSDGRVKVLDFGIARWLEETVAGSLTTLPTMTGTVVGTPAYMAPETLRGAPADRRSDIWSLGVVLYEMVAGRRPFSGQTSFELSSAILRDEPEPLPPHVPTSLRAVIGRCLAKDPAARDKQAGEVRAALETIAMTATWEGSSFAPPGQVVQMPSHPPISTATDKSIIVLPFANLSPNPDDEYFGDGLTDELITDLARITNLRVAPSGASFRLKNTQKDLATIGRDLNVRYVVEGRVRKVGPSIRITAQLVDVLESRTIWADKYTGDLERVFELQERVSLSIAAALQLQLQPSKRAPQPEAVEAYLKGRHFFRQATNDGFVKALEQFRRATDVDPEFASAMAALAYTYVWMTAVSLALPAREAMPKAEAAARHALELDPRVPEAHVALALVATFYDWDLRRAESAFQEALRLNPNDADAHGWYTVPLIWLDTRFDVALDHARRAVELNPVDPWIRLHLCWTHYFRRDFERCIDETSRLIDVEPHWGMGHYFLGAVLATCGRASEAVTSIERGIALDGRGVHYVAWLGFGYAITGRRADALRCLAELEAHEQAGKSVWAWQLVIYSGLGNADQVMNCLEQAFEERSASLVFHLTHPLVDCVRRDSRFHRILRKMKVEHLVNYWPQREWLPPTA
jgi:serine/threonine-protein kinase